MRIAVIGCGTIGRRVAAAVVRQPDMELAGVGIRRPGAAALAASMAGHPIYDTSADGDGGLEARGFRVAGGFDDLLAAADVAIDCGQARSAATRRAVYDAAGVPLVVCGGERDARLGPLHSTFANYGVARGARNVRVASCNVTALTRLLAILDEASGVRHAHAALVRCATDPDKAHKGVVAGASVSAEPSHHCDDLAALFGPEMVVSTQAIAVPMTTGHVVMLGAELAGRTSADDVLARLAGAPRVLLRDSEQTDTIARCRMELRRDGLPPEDMPEVLVWTRSVRVRDGHRVQLVAGVHMESITIPELVDCVRDVTGTVADRDECIRLTDRALGIERPAAVGPERLHADAG